MGERAFNESLRWEVQRPVTGEKLSLLVGRLVSHWEDGWLGRKGGVGREKNILTRVVKGDLKKLERYLKFRGLRQNLGLTVVIIDEILIKDINPLFVCVPELPSHFNEKGVVEEESSYFADRVVKSKVIFVVFFIGCRGFFGGGRSSGNIIFIWSAREGGCEKEIWCDRFGGFLNFWFFDGVTIVNRFTFFRLSFRKFFALAPVGHMTCLVAIDAYGVRNTNFQTSHRSNSFADTEARVTYGLIKGDLNQTLKMFWELENVELERTKNEEAIFCEDHFLKTHSRDEEGRYVVKMPLKNEPNCLGESRDIALKRLNALWTRLIRDPQYLKLNRDFIHEYDQLGHMKEVVAENDNSPHHGILRPKKKHNEAEGSF
ncbi:uncharacterized protein TNCV_27171 [Trichonephila clavipes]|uniref:Uncharacterized protein n=1 Tax=Trichonephila clavipes TaxID=2585209 RepID=A0A8X7BLK8_TRICX|nr:uncharacterized protein TNCV_27171 [Trichonephila clavipes]